MGKGGQKSETSKQAPNRKTKAAVDRRQNNTMLRQCPSGIAQRPPHHAVAVPTAMQNRVTKSVAPPLELEPEPHPSLHMVAQWFEHRTRDCKIAGSNPAGAAVEFSSAGSTFCAEALISVSVPPPCYRSRHIKDPGHAAVKSAGGRLQLNTHTPYVCGFA